MTHVFPSMGGSVEVQFPDPRDCAFERIEALFEAHERAMSRFVPDSELCALNEAMGRFLASPLLFDVVSEALGWACATDGAFDPTIIDALEACGYDRSFEDIGRGGAAVATARRPPLRRGAWRRIDLDAEHSTIAMPDGVRIDLGGIGKGYTVDRAIALLGAGVNAMVNASGDLYAAGDGPDGDGWYVGVQDPFVPETDLAVLNVNDCGVATSGSIKRQWRIGDARYHHLIDSRERTSAQSDLLTVTVVAPTATEADVLAKTAFLLGAHAGLRMIERMDGAECLAVATCGDVLTTYGMREYYA